MSQRLTLHSVAADEFCYGGCSELERYGYPNKGNFRFDFRFDTPVVCNHTIKVNEQKTQMTSSWTPAMPKNMPLSNYFFQRLTDF